LRIISNSRLWTGGSFHWGSPVTISQYGVTVRRATNGTEIRFPSGDSVNLPADAPWQEINQINTKKP
jgi:hypothetical protein